VHIHHDDVRFTLHIGHQSLGDAERTVIIRHVCPAHDIEDADLHFPHRINQPAGTGSAGRIVSRPQQFRVGIEILENIDPVPDMVAGGLGVDPVREHLARHLRRNTETTGGVLDIARRIARRISL